MKIGDIVKHKIERPCSTQTSLREVTIECERQGDLAWYIGAVDAHGEPLACMSNRNMSEFEAGCAYQREIDLWSRP